MKKHIKSLFIAMMAVSAPVLMTSCSEDDYYNVDINGVPEASAYADAVKVTVDQETNTAYFEFEAPGVYPVWIIDGKNYSSNMSFSRYYRKAGEYSVDLKVANGNGVSKGTITKTFTIDKTKMNGFPGFVYDSEFNLWTKADRKINSFFYANPDWSPRAEPSHSFDGDTFTVTLPEPTEQQWQAQAHIGTDICLPKGEHYDGSIIFTASQDMNAASLKIHPSGDDNNVLYFFDKSINLMAGEPLAVYFSDVEAPIDLNNLVYTFDFGGNPAGVEIMVENIVLKKHSDDDGTVVPEQPKDTEPVWVAYDSTDNLFYGMNFTPGFYYAPGWSQIADPGFSDNGDGSFTFTLPTATSDRWQAQCFLNSTLAIEDPTVEYDFCVTIESNMTLPAVMFKLVQTDESPDVKHDKNSFFADEREVKEGVTKLWWSKVKLAEGTPAHAISMIFDFGGNPDGVEVTVSKMILQKHHD